MVRNTCSIVQRARYQLTICKASARLATGCVVNRSHRIGFDPLGRIDLLDPNRAQLDLGLQAFDVDGRSAVARIRPLASSPGFAPCGRAGRPWPEHGDLPPRDRGQRRHRSEQLDAVAHDAIVVGAPEQMDVSGARRQRISRKYRPRGRRSRSPWRLRPARGPRRADPRSSARIPSWRSGAASCVPPPSSCVRPEAPSSGCRCWRPRARECRPHGPT